MSCSFSLYSVYICSGCSNMFSKYLISRNAMILRFTRITCSVWLLLLLQEECWGRPSEFDKTDSVKNLERDKRSLAAQPMAAPRPSEVLIQQLANVGSHKQRIVASIKSPVDVLSLFSNSDWTQLREQTGLMSPLSGQNHVIRVVRNADEGMMGQAGAAGGKAIRNIGQQMSGAINKASEKVDEHSAMAGTVIGMAGPTVQDKINEAADQVGQFNPMAGHAMKIGAEAVPHAANAASDAISQGGEVASKMMNMASTGIQHGANAAADVFSKTTRVFGKMIPMGGGGGGQAMGQAANMATKVATGMVSAGTSIVGSMFG